MTSKVLAIALVFSQFGSWAQAREYSVSDLKQKTGDRILVIEPARGFDLDGFNIKQCKYNKSANQYYKCNAISESGRIFYSREEFETLQRDFLSRTEGVSIAYSSVVGTFIGGIAFLSAGLVTVPLTCLVIAAGVGGVSGKALYDYSREESAQQDRHMINGVFKDRNDVVVSNAEYALVLSQLKAALDQLM